MRSSGTRRVFTFRNGWKNVGGNPKGWHFTTSENHMKSHCQCPQVKRYWLPATATPHLWLWLRSGDQGWAPLGQRPRALGLTRLFSGSVPAAQAALGTCHHQGRGHTAPAVSKSGQCALSRSVCLPEGKEGRVPGGARSARQAWSRPPRRPGDKSSGRASAGKPSPDRPGGSRRRCHQDGRRGPARTVRPGRGHFPAGPGQRAVEGRASIYWGPLGSSLSWV